MSSFYLIWQPWFSTTGADASIGPNTLTFIVSQLNLHQSSISLSDDTESIRAQIPAEIFPTEYRCRCHGISAAAGKLGAILVQVLLWNLHSQHLAITLGLFSIPMAFGALLAWVWIPELQEGPDPTFVPSPFLFFFRKFPKLPNKGLETLARGISYARGIDTGIDPRTNEPRGEGQRLGFSQKVPDLFNKIWNHLSNGGFSARQDETESQESIVQLDEVAVSPIRTMKSTHGFDAETPGRG